MNPTDAKIDFRKLAQKSLNHLSIIEREIIDFKTNNGAIISTNPKYWGIKKDGTASVFLRLDQKRLTMQIQPTQKAARQICVVTDSSNYVARESILLKLHKFLMTAEYFDILYYNNNLQGNDKFVI